MRHHINLRYSYVEPILLTLITLPAGLLIAYTMVLVEYTFIALLILLLTGLMTREYFIYIYDHNQLVEKNKHLYVQSTIVSDEQTAIIYQMMNEELQAISPAWMWERANALQSYHFIKNKIENHEIWSERELTMLNQYMFGHIDLDQMYRGFLFEERLT